MTATEQNNVLTARDFASDQEIKWCPSCGDYTILKQIQSILPEYITKKENVVFVSGIGCSSRLPYYMNTYGLHSIHGRATAIATGIKLINPELEVWVITGDGDLMSIGGNHFIHLLRRNPNLRLIMFNNEIYGLTKGQYSPTSYKGQVTKSTPFGSVDEPFNPPALALGAKATFVARTIDRDPKHQQTIYRRATRHKGTAFVEVYQNCPVFNDETFKLLTEKDTKKDHTLMLEHGKPLIFGAQNDKGVRLDGLKPVVVDLNTGISPDELWIHDETDKTKAFLLARFAELENMPCPFGVFYCEQRACFEDDVHGQMRYAAEKQKPIPLQKILSGDNTWEVV
ncbi:MAG: 2-oxoacid:ferredoxin oxidoreductase subunit beta [Chitinophagales bacterium]|nr:2-oxoacid:ferredoxin oxidoreductase subunit beta [Chitinophagales bacterium]MDW8417826.1 2-oxoacid:ferredoxin oxidoreductase subunit beta [Chitinophagales bacterium]